MFKDELFTRVALSYQRLLSTFGEAVPGLRAYCRTQHVVYGDFIRWATTQEICTGVIEVERLKKRMKKGAGAVTPPVKASFPSSGKGTITPSPLLYPLHMITVPHSHRTSVGEESLSSGSSVVQPSMLRDVRVTFPNGVKVSVGEADGRSLHYLVHGIEP